MNSKTGVYKILHVIFSCAQLWPSLIHFSSWELKQNWTQPKDFQLIFWLLVESLCEISDADFSTCTSVAQFFGICCNGIMISQLVSSTGTGPPGSGFAASCEGPSNFLGAHKGPILLCVALLHHPAPGHSRSAQTPVLSRQNYILNLPCISHFIELQQEFLCWVIHLCTWFGHTFETKQACQG